MNEAEVIKKVMVPNVVVTDNNGFDWLEFSYLPEERAWKFPKVLKFNGKFFIWKSYNSDRLTVNYKEGSENDFATVV